MNLKPVYIVDAFRTPFLKARSVPGPFSASDLAVFAGKALLLRQPFSAEKIEEVIVGCVMPSEEEANIARIIALRLGCGETTPAWTVQRNCASGLQSIDAAVKEIQQDRYDLVLVGGTEAMSRAPLVLKLAMAAWLGKMYAKSSFGEKLKLLVSLRPSFFIPTMTLLRGLRDPICALSMGQTAEILAGRFGITREEMDAFALQSHERLAAAQDGGYLSEIVAIYDHEGHFYDHDTGLYRDSSMTKLSALRPYFDKPFGLVTPGNSSQVTDGAVMMLLASERAVERHQLSVLGKIVDIEWAALSPEIMGLGPVMAATPLLARHEYGFSDIDYWEINEAFAAQVLACLKAWESDAFCQEHLHLQSAMGILDQERLNVDGGAIAMGHPVGASGTRIVMRLLNVLKRHHAKRGIAAICIGGGQGGAILLEV